MIRLAFYKYTKKPINLGISLWTWLPNIGTPSYSHVEIGFRLDGHWKYYSSTMRDGARGTRWIREDKMIKHPERWDIYEVDEHRSLGDMVKMLMIMKIYHMIYLVYLGSLFPLLMMQISGIVARSVG